MRALKRLVAAALALVLVGAVTTQAIRMWIETRVPQDGMRIEVADTRLHVVDRGKGPAVVLIHGLMGQMRNFSPELVEALVKEHRVILLDRPGSGYSDPLPAGANGIAEQADVIATLIEQMDLGAPVVVGHSLCGAVALSLALDHPTKVGALALVAPATRPRRETPSAFKAIASGFEPIRRALSVTFATPLGLIVFDRAASAFFAPEPLPETFTTEGGGLLALRPGNVLAGGNDFEALRDALPDLSARYGELDLSLDILFGSADRIVDPTWNGLWLADQVSGATYAEIEGGHMNPF